MDAGTYAIAASLWVLCGLLVVLCARGLRHYFARGDVQELMWSGGLALAAAAMAIEAVVFAGLVADPLLQAYVFASAALVGVLSLGATRALKRPRLARAYTGYIGVAVAALAVFSFLTPVPAGMVTDGVIMGNPSLLQLVMSSLVTFPATVVLLLAAALALRRSRKWPTLLLIAGALVLGAGGTLYIASFPVALYYTEFVGIVLLFFGVVSLPRPVPASATSPVLTTAP